MKLVWNMWYPLLLIKIVLAELHSQESSSSSNRHEYATEFNDDLETPRMYCFGISVEKSKWQKKNIGNEHANHGMTRRSENEKHFLQSSKEERQSVYLCLLCRNFFLYIVERKCNLVAKQLQNLVKTFSPINKSRADVQH